MKGELYCCLTLAMCLACFCIRRALTVGSYSNAVTVRAPPLPPPLR